MMKRYTLNDNFRLALERLFDQPSMALEPLGAGTGPNDGFGPDLDTTIPAEERIRRLKSELEAIVSRMSVEAAEIGCNETTDAFRMQSIGLLVALREIQRHFPEVRAVN